MPNSLTLTLAVADLDSTETFYGATLGLAMERFHPLPGSPPLLLLRRGDAALLFRESVVLEALHPALLQNLERHPKGVGASLELQVADLGPVRRRLERLAWPILYELEDSEFERREVWVHDPDGYLLVLGAPLA